MFKRPIALMVLVSFFSTMIISPRLAYAQGVKDLPVPGVMVNLSASYTPLLIKGLVIHPENPFAFDFLVDTGNSNLESSSVQLKEESSKLIKYFMAAMTIPEKDLWVNLSPYEKDRMMAESLAQTEMGQDMLAQDYILKQITASLIYPEKDLGREFWNKIYTKAQQLYGTSEIPVNTFNKVWIVADKADVFERGNAAYVVGAHLKVMLEEDYLAVNKQMPTPQALNVKAPQGTKGTTNEIGSQIIRDIILPELEREINQGQNFAPLRQMFYSMILASWFKMALKDSIMTQLYGNKAKVRTGISTEDPTQVNQIYDRYLKAYKKGVFNYIKEDFNQTTKQVIPKKYFSGGAHVWQNLRPKRITDPAQVADGAMSAQGQWLNVNAAMTVPKSAKQPDAAMTIEDRSWQKRTKELSGQIAASQGFTRGHTEDLIQEYISYQTHLSKAAVELQRFNPGRINDLKHAKIILESARMANKFELGVKGFGIFVAFFNGGNREQLEAGLRDLKIGQEAPERRATSAAVNILGEAGRVKAYYINKEAPERFVLGDLGREFSLKVAIHKKNGPLLDRFWARAVRAANPMEGNLTVIELHQEGQDPGKEKIHQMIGFVGEFRQMALSEISRSRQKTAVFSFGADLEDMKEEKGLSYVVQQLEKAKAVYQHHSFVSEDFADELIAELQEKGWSGVKIVTVGERWKGKVMLCLFKTEVMPASYKMLLGELLHDPDFQEEVSSDEDEAMTAFKKSIGAHSQVKFPAKTSVQVTWTDQRGIQLIIFPDGQFQLVINGKPASARIGILETNKLLEQEVIPISIIRNNEGETLFYNKSLNPIEITSTVPAQDAAMSTDQERVVVSLRALIVKGKIKGTMASKEDLKGLPPMDEEGYQYQGKPRFVDEKISQLPEDAIILHANFQGSLMTKEQAQARANDFLTVMHTMIIQGQTYFVLANSSEQFDVPIKVIRRTTDDAAMAVKPMQAQLNDRIEKFGLSVVHQTAAKMLTKELRGAYWHLKQIVERNSDNKPQLFIDLQVLFESILSNVSADEEGIDGYKSLRGIMNWFQQSQTRPQDFTDTEIRKLEGSTQKAIKDAADALAKRIFEQTSKQEGIIMMVRVSEGFGRDEVAESLRSNEVIVPDEIRGENVHINEAIRAGEQLYYSSQQDKWYPIIDAILDVIEGTNQFVTNTKDKPLEELTDNEAGATSFIVFGPGVRALGNLPDGYTGQFFTNLGNKDNVQRLLKRRIIVAGQEYSLNDPELYAKQPERIEDYLQFLAEIRGQKLEELQEQIVVLDRKRETQIIKAVRKLQQRIPGLTLNIIEDGTFTQGIKAILDQETYERALDKPFGSHKTMITVGGSAEGFAVLALAGVAREKGSVGGVRVYSAKLNMDINGDKISDHSRRYNFNREEEDEIGQLRPHDAQEILNGKKLFTIEDVQGEVSGKVSFITNNGVFEQPGTQVQGMQVVTQVLSISNLGGELKVVLTSENQNSDAAMGIPLTVGEPFTIKKGQKAFLHPFQRVKIKTGGFVRNITVEAGKNEGAYTTYNVSGDSLVQGITAATRSYEGLFIGVETANNNPRVYLENTNEGDVVCENFPIDIKELGLGTRLEGVLIKGGVDTLQKLIGKTSIDLLEVPDFGKILLEQVRGILLKQGYYLMGEKPLGPNGKADRETGIVHLTLGDITKKLLISMGILTVGQLTDKTSQELERKITLGDGKIKEIRTALLEHGLYLKGEDAAMTGTMERVFRPETEVVFRGDYDEALAQDLDTLSHFESEGLATVQPGGPSLNQANIRAQRTFNHFNQQAFGTEAPMPFNPDPAWPVKAILAFRSLIGREPDMEMYLQLFRIINFIKENHSKREIPEERIFETGQISFETLMQRASQDRPPGMSETEDRIYWTAVLKALATDNRFTLTFTPDIDAAMSAPATFGQLPLDSQVVRVKGQGFSGNPFLAAGGRIVKFNMSPVSKDGKFKVTLYIQQPDGLRPVAAILATGDNEDLKGFLKEHCSTLEVMKKILDAVLVVEEDLRPVQMLNVLSKEYKKYRSTKKTAAPEAADPSAPNAAMTGDDIKRILEENLRRDVVSLVTVENKHLPAPGFMITAGDDRIISFDPERVLQDPDAFIDAIGRILTLDQSITWSAKKRTLHALLTNSPVIAAVDRNATVTISEAAILREDNTVSNTSTTTPGGIDFNRDKMQMNISKDGKGLEIKFDPAMIEKLKKEGFDGFVPVILNITPIQSILPILGLLPKREEQLAKG